MTNEKKEGNFVICFEFDIFCVDLVCNSIK